LFAPTIVLVVLLIASMVLVVSPLTAVNLIYAAASPLGFGGGAGGIASLTLDAQEAFVPVAVDFAQRTVGRFRSGRFLAASLLLRLS